MEGDPSGMIRTRDAPGSIGGIFAISSEKVLRTSDIHDFPILGARTLRGGEIQWARRISEVDKPTHREKLAVLGGNIALLYEEVSSSMGELAVGRSYEVGIARHIIRETRNHFVANLLPIQSREGVVHAFLSDRHCGFYWRFARERGRSRASGRALDAVVWNKRCGRR